MSARAVRPARGAAITPGMSIRDQAAALGVSRSELCRWRALAQIPGDEFERRLATLREKNIPPSASAVLTMNSPVPARGRVQRAAVIYANMAPAERRDFLVAIGLHARGAA